MKKENYTEFVEQLQAHAREKIEDKDLNPDLEVDCAVEPSDFTRENAQKVENFGPFGIGNSEPIFLLADVHIQDCKSVGAKAEHLQFYAQKGPLRLKGIAFRFGDKITELQKSKDILFKLKTSTWTREGVEIELVDARA